MPDIIIFVLYNKTWWELVDVDVTDFLEHIFSLFGCWLFIVFVSHWGFVKIKINSLWLFSLTQRLGLVHMRRVDDISKKSWRPTALQEHIWVTRLKAIREYEAEGRGGW